MSDTFLIQNTLSQGGYSEYSKEVLYHHCFSAMMIKPDGTELEWGTSAS